MYDDDIRHPTPYSYGQQKTYWWIISNYHHHLKEKKTVNTIIIITEYKKSLLGSKVHDGALQVPTCMELQHELTIKTENWVGQTVDRVTEVWHQ